MVYSDVRPLGVITLMLLEGYADDTTLMEKSEEELKSLLMKVKEDIEKDGLKFNFQKTKIIQSHHFMANRWTKGENSG